MTLERTYIFDIISNLLSLVHISNVQHGRETQTVCLITRANTFRRTF